MITKRPTLNDRVLQLEYERPDQHWWMVTAYGWAIDPDPDHNAALHNQSFATKSEALAYRKWLRPCSCLRCTSKGKESGGTQMHDYECNARMRPVDIIRAETSWAARKQYAERHGVAVSDCIARRRDIPDSWKPYINETP